MYCIYILFALFNGIKLIYNIMFCRTCVLRESLIFQLNQIFLWTYVISVLASTFILSLLIFTEIFLIRIFFQYNFLQPFHSSFVDRFLCYLLIFLLSIIYIKYLKQEKNVFGHGDCIIYFIDKRLYIFIDCSVLYHRIIVSDMKQVR